MDTAKKIIFFSSKEYDISVFGPLAERHNIDLHFIESRLDIKTVSLTKGFDTVCVFVNDDINRKVIENLKASGVKHIALRCAGYNNVDVEFCHSQGIQVSHVPAYAPQAVAEHAMALILTLNRRMHKAYNRVKEGNFDLNGLLGFTLHGKTIGVVGSGNIGDAFIQIAKGFGCRILCFDPSPNIELVDEQLTFTDIETLMSSSDIISLHCPLNDKTHHLINDDSITLMKQGVMLINTSRGGLIDTNALIRGLKSKKVGYVGLDVYEMESELFFRDRSCEVIQDDLFQRLSTFHNVLITGHQGFFTQEAISEIAQATITNAISFWNNNADKAHFL